MNIIFIDTNIFLRFYEGNRKELKNLLNSILNIAEKVFITEQIVFEIERNKLSVFRKSINNYTNNLKIQRIELPEHLSVGLKQNEIEKWNTNREKIREENKQLTDDIDNILLKNLIQISESKDNVSKVFKKLYQHALNATEEEFKRAKKRKDIGNPPGKSNDPLGDQITWEQFLSIAPSVKEIWFVTNDGDFITEYRKNFFLNSFLYSELININPHIKINCFNNLIDGLESFKKKNIIPDFPDKALLQDIRNEEKSIRTQVISSNIRSIGYCSDTQVLEIEFSTGSVYKYFDVPQNVYNELLSSESHGKNFANNIKGNYSYLKV